jgi:hypothetical protein
VSRCLRCLVGDLTCVSVSMLSGMEFLPVSRCLCCLYGDLTCVLVSILFVMEI